MKVVILGKRDTMGTNPMIRIKGMSRLQYPFMWDPEIRHYAYEPKEQREVDDIFRTQNRLYKTIHFSAWIDGDENKECCVKDEDKEVTVPEPDIDIEELLGYEEEDEKPKLLKRCRDLNIPVIPQDRPSSLKRLLKAFQLGYQRT